MGYYINPPSQSKEDFLEREAIEVTRTEFLEFVGWGKIMPVCLVQNPAFSAAAIAYNAEERDYFADMADGRPKRYFLVEHTALDAIGVNYPK